MVLPKCEKRFQRHFCPAPTVDRRGGGKSEVAAFAQFVQQLLVIVGAGAARVVAEDVLVQRRAFSDGHVFRDGGVQQFIAVALAQFVPDIVAHAAASVEAGEQVAPLDTAFEHGFQHLEGARDVLGGLQRQVVRGDRDNQPIAGKNGVQCQDADVGAAVDQHRAARQFAVQFLQAVAEFVQNRRSFAENGVDLDQLLMGRQELAQARPFHFELLQRCVVLVEGKEAAVGLQGGVAMDAGEVPLRVEVDQQGRGLGALEGGAQIEGRRGFSDAAFLVENGDAHGSVILYKALFFT